MPLLAELWNWTNLVISVWLTQKSLVWLPAMEDTLLFKKNSLNTFQLILEVDGKCQEVYLTDCPKNIQLCFGRRENCQNWHFGWPMTGEGGRVKGDQMTLKHSQVESEFRKAVGSMWRVHWRETWKLGDQIPAKNHRWKGRRNCRNKCSTSQESSVYM